MNECLYERNEERNSGLHDYSESDHDIAPDTPDNDVESLQAVGPHNGFKHRLHGEVIGATTNRSRIDFTGLRSTFADKVYEDCVKGRLQLREGGVCQIDEMLVHMFRISYRLDQIPVAAMQHNKCAICGYDLCEQRTWDVQTHVYKCGKAKAEQDANRSLTEAVSAFLGPGRTCASTKKTYRSDCSTIFTSVDAYLEHMKKKHVESSKLVGGAHQSVPDGCNEAFPTRRALSNHWYDDHAVPSWRPTSDLYNYCEICEGYHIHGLGDKGRREFAEADLPKLSNFISSYEYWPYSCSRRIIQPGSCVFCYHDASAPTEDRVYSPNAATDLRAHVNEHIARAFPGGHGSDIHCPPSVDNQPPASSTSTTTTTCKSTSKDSAQSGSKQGLVNPTHTHLLPHPHNVLFNRPLVARAADRTPYICPRIRSARRQEGEAQSQDRFCYNEEERREAKGQDRFRYDEEEGREAKSQDRLCIHLDPHVDRV